MSHPDVTVTITADVSRIAAAFEKVQDAFANFAETMAKVSATFAEHRDRIRTWSLTELRAHHGGNGTDARRWPALWQSAACSAWLHGSCPSDAHQLECTCTCHGRSHR